MEEKKLTDEEIVKALDFCVKNRENCRFDCDLKICEDDNFLIKILDLIHRLQEENKQIDLENYELYKQIADLKIRLHNKDEENKKCEETIFNELCLTLGITKALEELEKQKKENAELQKQVDELKERYLEESKERCKFEQLYERKCHDHNIGAGVQRTYWEKKVQQAVKDTAEKFAERAKVKLNEWLEDNEDINGKIDFGIAMIELIGVKSLEGEVIAESLIDEICKELTESK